MGSVHSPPGPLWPGPPESPCREDPVCTAPSPQPDIRPEVRPHCWSLPTSWVQPRRLPRVLGEDAQCPHVLAHVDHTPDVWGLASHLLPRAGLTSRTPGPYDGVSLISSGRHLCPRLGCSLHPGFRLRASLASRCHPCHAGHGHVLRAECCLHGPETWLGFESSCAPRVVALPESQPLRPSSASLCALWGG